MQRILLFIKGIVMGICDVIPGVSGGTIAFITGIYDELLDALHGFSVDTLRLTMQGKFLKAWRAIHGNFLVTLFLGIIIAIIGFSHLVEYLLTTYPALVRAFFFGLIVASAVLLRHTVKKRTISKIIFLLLGAVSGFLITTLPVLQLGFGPGQTIIAGALAAIALILPGISGSYILLLLGQYQHILQTLTTITGGTKEVIVTSLAGTGESIGVMMGNLPRVTLCLFIVGVIIGLLLFARVLHWLKEKYHDTMMAILIGLMLGSLNKLRPRKQIVETYVDRHGEVQPLVEQNVNPANMKQLLWGIGFALGGFAIVMIIHMIAHALQKRNKK